MSSEEPYVESEKDFEITESTSKGQKREWFELDDEHNTYVFVSGLPVTTTEEEFVEMMKKYGVIRKKTEKNNPYNIKLYKDKQTGQFKGEGICCYAMKESVDLALELLDGMQYEGNSIHCEKAQFKLKGDFDPSKKPKPLDNKSKKKQRKKIDKILSWEQPIPTPRVKKVILKYMFVPEELENPEYLLELKEDVETGCEGLVPQRINICDKNPEGVVEIIFKDADEAEKCVNLMNGRYYAGRKVEASLWDGKTKYKIQETEEEAEARHERYQRDLIEN